MDAIKENKRLTRLKPIKKIPVPRIVYIPLSQHIGTPLEPVVTAGETVNAGQLIGQGQKGIYCPVHASVSGKIQSIRDWPHPLLGSCRAVVIESAPDQQEADFPAREISAEKLSCEDIRHTAKEAGIVGMGGAAFPTYIKLNPPEPVDTLIVNGTECEPYLNADFRLMLENAEQIIKGALLAQKCLKAGQVFIAIENINPEAAKAFSSKLPAGFSVKVIKAGYPQGAEKQLIKNLLKRDIPPGKLPFHAGAVVQNVATLYALYEAVHLGKPLIERVTTLSGDCLSRPANLLVKIGTPVSSLLEECGPFTKQPKKVIFGGPMMGMAQLDLNTPVIKSTNGILFLSEDFHPEDSPGCFRCGRCVEHCPLGLLPCMIALASEKGKWDLARSYGCLECMECGLCSYVCPHRKPVVQLIKNAKKRTMGK